MYQQLWTTPNVFAAGEMTLPNGSETQTGGTHPDAMSYYMAAEGIQMYLANPGPLVA
jgi:hypothetical protein